MLADQSEMFLGLIILLSVLAAVGIGILIYLKFFRKKEDEEE